MLTSGDNNRQLRGLKQKKQRSLELSKQHDGTDWKKVKFKNARSIHGTMLGLESTIQKGLELSDSACERLTALNRKGELWTSTSQDSSCDFNDICKVGNDTKQQSHSLFIKQRSQQWYGVKKIHPVSGSSQYDIIGFQTLKKAAQVE